MLFNYILQNQKYKVLDNMIVWIYVKIYYGPKLINNLVKYKIKIKIICVKKRTYIMYKFIHNN